MLKADEVYLAEIEFNIINKLSKSELINMINSDDVNVKLSEMLMLQESSRKFGNVSTETIAQVVYLVFSKIKTYLSSANSRALIDINYAPNNTSLFILHE